MNCDINDINGVLERIIFFNEDNSYCIGEISVENTTKKIIIKGELANVQCGETLKLKGTWVEDKKHGRQFKVLKVERKLPASIYGIKKLWWHDGGIYIIYYYLLKNNS